MINYHELVLNEFKLMTPRKKKDFLHPVFSIKDNFSVENREKNEKILKQWDKIRIELYKEGK